MSPRGEKSKKKPKNIIASNDTSAANDAPEVIVENLYKKNIEILNKNKTLSLLSKLYEISILTLKPRDLAARISQTVRVDLSFELVGIFIFEAESDALTPLAFAKSERSKSTLEKLHLSFEDMKIPHVAKQSFFNKTVSSKEENMSNDLEEVWGDLVDRAKLESIDSESHIKTTLLYPLMVESRVLGVILLALNRNYETLNAFEKESIKSFINVIALALEKSYLYQELENANAQLRELDKEKDELLSIVSHQLATPITSVKWYLEILLDGDMGKLSDEQTKRLKLVQQIVANLTDLVGMILDVSRIHLGKMKIDKGALNLKEFFAEIISTVLPKTLEKKVNFQYALPDTLPTAMLDKRYTKMIIENLLTNAIKYTPTNGNVNFLVEIRGSMLYCEVQDSGCGIPKQDQPKIFDRLYRASNVRNTVEGNGFGLYIAKGAVEKQGGRIWFESEEGKGTVFHIELPLQ